jgi:hypothetical protein
MRIIISTSSEPLRIASFGNNKPSTAAQANNIPNHFSIKLIIGNDKQ